MNTNTIIRNILKDKILIMDGAMGSILQKMNLSEKDFRGEEFKNWNYKLKGNFDVLNISQSIIISQIHKEYLQAGADIITTNTINSSSISLKKYGLESYTYEINFAGAKIAKEIALKFTNYSPNKPRFVAGSIGPSNISLSNNKSSENIDTFIESYYQQAIALLDGGSDIILIETIYDELNAKAAIMALERIMAEREINIPIMLSGTISENKELSQQALLKLLDSYKNIDLLSIGFNCGNGSSQIIPYIQEISEKSDYFISAYPNAGIPNNDGIYKETPMDLAKNLKTLTDNKSVNIIGGCCGTTPKYIKQIAKLVH